MIDLKQFRDYVIRPTLALLNLGGAAAEQLLLGTALTESGLIWLHQMGSGPARGVYQIEPATHDDLWRNFLAFRQPMADLVAKLQTREPMLDQLITNLSYATAICRLLYYRHADPLPVAGDATAMAAYHKKIYNTAGGATDPTESVVNFQRAISVV